MGKRTWKKQLELLYTELNYPVIPALPDENECSRIMQSYKTYPASLVPKEYMNVMEDDLMRGHIIMVWWINKRKTDINCFPQYFLYKYGLNFSEEIPFLESKKLIRRNKSTAIGKRLLAKHKQTIAEHRSSYSINKDGTVNYQIYQPTSPPHPLIEDADYYTIICNLSIDTCDKCARLDNKVFFTKDIEVGENFPPHCNSCTCCASPYSINLRKEPHERWYRDPITNKGCTGIFTDYYHWLESMEEKYGSDIINKLLEKRACNHS